MTGRKRDLAGFTLIELLVVIGIISILAGLLLPMLSRAKDTARMIKCTNRLRQLAITIQVYADQWDGALVNGLSYGAYPPYPKPWPQAFKEDFALPDILFVCPAFVPDPAYVDMGHPYLNKHVVPPHSAFYWNNAYKNLDAIVSPSRVIAFSDGGRGDQGKAAAWQSDTHWAKRAWVDKVSIRHCNGFNTSFFDGHAARFTRTDDRSIWDPAVNPSGPPWKEP